MTVRRGRLALSALLCALALAALLAGCGTEQTAAAPQTDESVAEVEEQAPVELRLGTLTLTPETESVSLAGSGATVDELIAAADTLGGLRTISLGLTDATAEQLHALEAAYPQAEIDWRIALLGEEIDCRAESLDLSAATDGDVGEIVSALERLGEVKTLVLAPEEGLTELSFDSLAALAAAAPEAELNCRFELFGETADWTTEKLKYYKVKIGNEGVESFRAALPYLRSLKLLRFENCGITDNDMMDALRADFPEKNVVWSINISGYIFMTDTTRINDGDTGLLNDENAQLLRYMHDVLYLDVGHNHDLTNIEFVRNWPKLQVVILTLTQIRDITPLEDCPDMEYLEMVTTYIEDISVVAGMEKLEYLNLGCMPRLKDLSPVFGLKNLKIVRICGTTFTFITKAQVEELKEKLPDTTYVSDYGGDPTKSGGWRYKVGGGLTERYALLREQMGYDLNWWVRLSTSPSGEED